MGSTRERSGHRKELVKLKTEQYLTQFEYQRENKQKKKMNRASGWGDYSKRSSIPATESQKEIRKRVELEKIYEELTPENSPNLARTVNLQSRSQANPKPDKLPKIYARHIIIKLLKTKDKENS